MFNTDTLLSFLIWTALAEIAVLPLSIAISKMLNSSEYAGSESAHNLEIAKDRLRYTKNTTSSSLAYVAILFNVFYFVSIYNSDVGNYYYTSTIGISVICNLLFLLSAFLCSEGVKNYKLGYSIALIPLGLFQFVRILGIPSDAHSKTMLVDGSNVQVMSDSQFSWVCICLIASAIACLASGAFGIYQTKTLRDYEKKLSK